MGSYSDSTSDLDEELPVFDFLSQVSKSRTEKPNSDAVFSTAKVNSGACAEAPDVMMISSESDDDAPYVPLALRLKQRRDNVISASSVVTNGKDAEYPSPSNLAGAQLSCQNGFLESELSSRQVRTVSLDGPDEVAASSAKTKPAKRTADEIQSSREDALKRRQAREGQQKDKEVLRQEQERQKAERKALAEASKALRPEECIKHMVVAVDPDCIRQRQNKPQSDAASRNGGGSAWIRPAPSDEHGCIKRTELTGELETDLEKLEEVDTWDYVRFSK